MSGAATRLGVPGLATAIMPLPAMATHSRDLMNTGIDGLEFWTHEDEMSGVQFQRDLGRFALDVNSLPVHRDVARILEGLGVSQDLNSTSTARLGLGGTDGAGTYCLRTRERTELRGRNQGS